MVEPIQKNIHQSKRNSFNDFRHAIFDPKCQVKNQEKSTKKPVFEMHKRSINLEENYFFAYLMEIDLGNQNKTKKHACLRNTPSEKAVEFDLKCALVYVILIV